MPIRARRPAISAVILLACVASLGAWLVTGHDRAEARPAPSVDRALRNLLDRNEGQSVRVIVHARPGARHAARAALEAAHARIVSERRDLDLVTAALHAGDLAALATSPFIASLSLDAPVSHAGVASQIVNDTLLNTLGVRDSRFVGTNVGVAVIDSGFNPAAQPDFNPARVLFFDFTKSRSPQREAPYDAYGHGTHVAGLIASSGARSHELYQGVAPGVRLVVLKALDEKGLGYASTIVDAIDFAIANRQALGIDIINLSLGHPVYEPAATDPLVQAVERAVRAGIVVVAAAGNNGGDPATHEVGYAGINSPGNAASAITVGTLDMAGTVSRTDDVIPWYSSRGPTWYDGFQKPDLVAPGHRLVSDIDASGTLYASYPQLAVSANGRRDALLRLSGTSMSAAVTTGAVALVIDAARQTFGQAPSPNVVKALLQFSAIPMAGYDPITAGAGSLNVAGAVQLAQAIDPRVPTGSWWLTTGITPSTTIGADALAWSQQIIWGDRPMQGLTLFTNGPAWTARALWGADGLAAQSGPADSTVWTADSRNVWGRRIVWGENLIGYSPAPNAPAPQTVWGDASGVTSVPAQQVVWGDLTHTVISSLSNPGDPFGFGSLDVKTGGKPTPRTPTLPAWPTLPSDQSRVLVSAGGNK